MIFCLWTAAAAATSPILTFSPCRVVSLSINGLHTTRTNDLVTPSTVGSFAHPVARARPQHLMPRPPPSSPASPLYRSLWRIMPFS